MSSPPDWFERALAVPFTEHVAESGEDRVHYVRWGDEGAQPIVLIHGGGAHAFWWGYIAPLLAGYDVVAPDLTGHGDSTRRDRYPREVWCDDVLSVMAHAGFTRPPFLVGHSMGGLVSMAFASLHGDRALGAIIVDAPVRPKEPDRANEQRAWAFPPHKPLPDLKTAIERFRPLPEQPTVHPFLLDYVAARSLREEKDGFYWKFDPKIFERASTSSMRAYLASARCRLALIRGEESVVVSRETAAYMATVPPVPMPIIDIPSAHHHVMFDQPIALLVALRALLAEWSLAHTSAHPSY